MREPADGDCGRNKGSRMFVDVKGGSLVGEMSTHAKFMPATVIQRGGFLDGSNREGARVSVRASAHGIVGYRRATLRVPSYRT